MGGEGAAIVGVGETTCYRRGASPYGAFRLCIEAIQRAAEDAGVDVRDIDGVSSYADDKNTSTRVASALGLHELRFSTMAWGGGGGGCCAAVGNAAPAVLAGHAETVVVYRGIDQEGGRLGEGSVGRNISEIAGPRAYTVPYGLISPAQVFAMRVRRFMTEHRVGQEVLRSIALASYHHAQYNPRALRYGRALTAAQYDASRWIVEPFHLYDCCMESDGAAAVIVTTSERARDLRQPPAFIVASAQGCGPRKSLEALHNDEDYASANYRAVSRRLYEQSGLAPADIDVVQVYENFTGGVLMALVEHGFCAPSDISEFFRLDNLTWPLGSLPINTSGGNLAHAYIHGLELVVEGVRQTRGTSTCQVAGAHHSMVISAPMSSPVSSLILGSDLD